MRESCGKAHADFRAHVSVRLLDSPIRGRSFRALKASQNADFGGLIVYNVAHCSESSARPPENPEISMKGSSMPGTR